MYADIAVFSAKDPTKDVFTYFSDKVLKPGTLVLIPFGKQARQGIVIHMKPSSDVKKVLPVLKVLYPTPVLTQSQLALFDWLINYYACSFSAALSLLVPQFSQKILKTIPQETRPSFKPPKQMLILTPSVYLLQTIADHFAKRSVRGSIAIYHGDLTGLNRAKTYFAVRHGMVETIIATRIGLFLPFANLSTIYLYDEHDWGYKETRTPTYHAATVAQILASMSRSTLVIKDNTPRIQTLYQVRRQSNLRIDLRRSTKSQTYKISIVDMANEQKFGNQTLISHQLENAIRATLNQKQPILLFLNRKSDGGIAYCQSCKTATYGKAQPASCPKCQSNQIRFDVINGKRLAKEVNRLVRLWGFPTSLWQTNKEGSEISLAIGSNVAITIATQKILYTAKFRSCALLGVIFADTLLNLPEFRATEKTFTTINQLTQLVVPHSPIFIQTRQPDHPLFRYIATLDYQNFAKQELVERQQDFYPPFCLLILLSFSAKTTETTSRHATLLITQLTNLQAERNDSNVEVIGPFTALHQTTEVRILLKGKTRPALDQYLAVVPKAWKIDFDPENIVT